MASTAAVRYHREVGFPRDLRIRVGATHLRPTTHAAQALLEDRYFQPGDELPEYFQVRSSEVIEVTVEFGRVTKFLVRADYDEDRDLCMVLSGDASRVITCWFNLKSDAHRTLDTSAYARA